MSKGIHSSKQAFTLVELLVVIAIIGVLVALLLPAVQAARAAARRTQCQNNMKQVGLALLNYHSQNGEFPPSSRWPVGSDGKLQGIGSANFNRHLANWVILCLPFMEQQSIADAFDFTGGLGTPAAVNELARSAQIAGLLCPEDTQYNQVLFDGTTRAKTNVFGANWGRCNYAANAALGPMRTAHVDNGADIGAAGERSAGWQDYRIRGVMGANVGASIAQLTDGTSSTILAAEIRAGVTEFDVRGVWALGGAAPNSLWRHGYNGDAVGPNSPGDEADDMIGCTDVIKAIGSKRELARMKMGCIERTGNDQQTARSQHAGGVFVTFADGSVHFISDDVEVGADTFPVSTVWDRLNLSADSGILDPETY